MINKNTIGSIYNMPKAKNPTYNAGQLADACGIAESDLSWSVTALGDLSCKFQSLKKSIQAAHNVSDIYFDEMQEFLHMYEYLIQSRHSYHQEQAEVYEQEWKRLKGEVL